MLANGVQLLKTQTGDFNGDGQADTLLTLTGNGTVLLSGFDDFSAGTHIVIG